MYDLNRDLVWDCEQRAPVYVMRVAGGYDPDTLPPVGAETAVHGEILNEGITVCPNPFNPGTAIAVKVKGKGRGRGYKDVSIKIYDINGQLIKSLLPLPSHLEVRWNATGLPSGIYIIRAVIGNRHLSKRITLMK